MLVKEIMTTSAASCLPDTGLEEVARLMVEQDCGAIPVVESRESARLVGIVTDRDIACRAVARGRNPLDLCARDCMSAPVRTVSAEASTDDCCLVMEERRVRRVPVVDGKGALCGMVAQADIAIKASGLKAAEVVKQVSKPTREPSRVEAGRT